jgi:hypothetical protein
MRFVAETVLAVFFLGGCIHASGVTDAKTFPARTKLGVIGVAVLRAPTTGDIDAPPSRLGAAGARAARAVALTWFLGTYWGGPGGAAVAVFATPITAVGGAVHGGNDTANAKDTAARVAAIDRALATIDVRRLLERGILDVRRTDRPPLVSIADAAPDATFDTRLDVDVVQISFELAPQSRSDGYVRSTPFGDAEPARPWRFLSADANPRLDLVVRARVRLVRAADGHVLFERDIERRGASFLFETWAARDGANVPPSLEAACAALAARIVDELL